MNKTWKVHFFTLWSGQAISVLTSSVLQMALIWHLSIETNSAAVLSWASIAGFLPSAILGLFAGAMVDRWNRKLTIIGADLFIALISLSLALYAFFAELPIWLVLIILFVRSIGTAFHSPAVNAITPLLVPEDELTRCAGYTQALHSVGFMAGTAIAAVLYPIWSLSAMVMLDVFGAVIASIATALVPIPGLPAKDNRAEHPDIFAEMREGYHALRGHPGLFALLWIGAVFMFLFSPVSALFPLMTLGYFGGDTTMASLTEISFSAGMLLGGGLLGIWGGFKNRAHTLTFSIALLGLAICLSGLLPSSGFWIFTLLCGFMGLAVPFYTGPQTALMQEKLEPQYLGRIFGLSGSVMSFAMPLGLMLSGLLADRVSIENWFMLCGAAIVLLAFFTLSIKSVREIDT